jgi:Holliday junction DNA helicase RuvA
MITYVKGKLAEKNPANVVIETNGIGYYIRISLQTFSKIPDSESVKLYTYLSVKEDSHTLFGFFEKAEREIFKALISVSGIGPSTAITMLSSLETKQIQQAIATGDVATIKSIKGIGIKTAQRVILDLKDKILKTYDIDEDLLTTDNTIKNEALSALEVLGFTSKNTEKVIQKLLMEDPDLTLEKIIKQALKIL